MNATISHDDAAGFHLSYQGRAYRPIAHTVFDEGEQVRIASATPYSASTTYIVVRSADGSIVEDWKAVDA